MLKDIGEFFKNLPKILFGGVKDVFLLVYDLILWIKNLILLICKLVIKLITNFPNVVKKVGIFLVWLVKKIPITIISLLKGIIFILQKIVVLVMWLIKGIGKFIINIPNILKWSYEILCKLCKKIPNLLLIVFYKIPKTILVFICYRIPIMICKAVFGLGKKLINLFSPKTLKQQIFLVALLIGIVFGTMINFGVFGKIKFETPPLVEGVTPVFFIPVPESMQNFPWVMNLNRITEVSQNGFGLPVTLTVITTWVIIGLVFLIFFFGTKNLKIIPGKFQTLLESLYGAFDMITGQMLNTWRKKYFSYISSLLLFIILSNIVAFFPIPKVVKGVDGIIRISPALRTPTADLNTTVGLAVLTAIIFTAVSLKTNGLRNYIKGFLDPIFVMAPLNIIGEISKPVNISLRLFGNMFAGSVITGLLYMATTSYGPLATIVAPLHLYFDLFSGVVQGFVFSMLTMVYISGAYGDREYTENIENSPKIDLQREVA